MRALRVVALAQLMKTMKEPDYRLYLFLFTVPGLRKE